MSRLLGGFISLFTKKPNNTIVDNLTAKVTRFCSAVTMERERERDPATHERRTSPDRSCRPSASAGL